MNGCKEPKKTFCPNQSIRETKRRCWPSRFCLILPNLLGFSFKGLIWMVAWIGHS